MRTTRRISRAAGVAFALLMLADPGLAAERLRIGGTGATNELVKRLGAQFAADGGDVVELVPNLGTSGGNSAVADGVIDLCISGRPLNAAEAAKGLKVVGEFRTPFTLVTSHRTPNGLKRADVAQLYGADNPLWGDGQPVRIILRPTNESDMAVMADLFAGMGAAIARARSRPELSVAATDQDNAAMAEKAGGSLVGATFTQILMEKWDLRFVAIDGVEPSLEAYRAGTYPFGKTLYLVTGANVAPAVARFLGFVRSPRGIAVMKDAGVLPGAE